MVKIMKNKIIFTNLKILKIMCTQLSNLYNKGMMSRRLDNSLDMCTAEQLI